MQTQTNHELLNIECNDTTSLSTIISVIENYTCTPNNFEGFNFVVDLNDCQVSQDKFLPIIDNLMNYFSRCKNYIQSHIENAGAYFAYFSLDNNDKIGASGAKYFIHSLYNTLKNNAYGVVTFANNSIFANDTIAEFLDNSVFANCSAVVGNSTTTDNNMNFKIVFINGGLAQNNSCLINDIATAGYYLPLSEEAIIKNNIKVLGVVGVFLFLAFVGLGTAATRTTTKLLNNQDSIVDNDTLNESDIIEMQQENSTLIGTEQTDQIS